jgi:hypothetical protein
MYIYLPTHRSKSRANVVGVAAPSFDWTKIYPIEPIIVVFHDRLSVGVWQRILIGPKFPSMGLLSPSMDMSYYVFDLFILLRRALHIYIYI